MPRLTFPPNSSRLLRDALSLTLTLALAACGGGGGDGGGNPAGAAKADVAAAGASGLAGVPTDKIAAWRRVGFAEKSLARSTFEDLPDDERSAAQMMATSADLGTTVGTTIVTTPARASAAAVQPTRTWQAPADTGSGIDYPIERYRSWVVRSHAAVITDGGHAVTAWFVDNGFGNAYFRALHRDAGSSAWVMRDLPMGYLDPDGFQGFSELQLVTVNGNDVLAVWSWRDTFHGEVRAAYYSAATGSWSGPYTVPGSTFDGVNLDNPPRIVPDGQGGAILVGIGGPASDDSGWQQLGLWAVKFDRATLGWKTPFNLRMLTRDFTWEGAPDVHTTADGKLFIAYTTRCLPTARTATWVQLYDPTTNASRWPNLLSVEQLRAYAPKILPLNYGRAVITWSGSEGETGAWWRLIGPDTWPLTAAARITGAPSDARVASTGTNDAFLFWSDGARPTAQWKAQRYNGATKVWGAPADLFTQTGDYATPPQFQRDGLGNLAAAWDAGDTSSTAQEVRLRRWSASSASWGAPSTPGAHAVPTGSAGYALTYPRLANHADGRMSLYWTDTTGYYGQDSPFVANVVAHIWHADWK
ncbi:hypothetical protein [Derxia gummosa]|uniref:Uncharacterized protein n=1 Tax=Derxia gummosa DSM 723 TaxID=1121388 RepID=A0A8B6XCE2_9BURK|nr:hypothetical protein [Derxia gummosa]